MAGILEQVYAAEGLILATPIYYENVSGQMKTFMDRNARPQGQR
jgi:multimeric flavodoxin WrbA